MRVCGGNHIYYVYNLPNFMYLMLFFSFFFLNFNVAWLLGWLPYNNKFPSWIPELFGLSKPLNIPSVCTRACTRVYVSYEVT